jgi:hypothetical protein
MQFGTVFSMVSEDANMTRDVFEEKWKQIRAQTRGWWSLFTDYDLIKLDKAPVKRDKYVVMLQVKYGYTRESAMLAITKKVAEYEAGLKSEMLTSTPGG